MAVESIIDHRIPEYPASNDSNEWVLINNYYQIEIPNEIPDSTISMVVIANGVDIVVTPEPILVNNDTHDIHVFSGKSLDNNIEVTLVFTSYDTKFVNNGTTVVESNPGYQSLSFLISENDVVMNNSFMINEIIYTTNTSVPRNKNLALIDGVIPNKFSIGKGNNKSTIESHEDYIKIDKPLKILSGSDSDNVVTNKQLEEEISNRENADEELRNSISDLSLEVNDKVSKVEGKGLSTNDYDDDDKLKLDNLANVKDIGSNLLLDENGVLSATVQETVVDNETISKNENGEIYVKEFTDDDIVMTTYELVQANTTTFLEDGE